MREGDVLDSSLYTDETDAADIQDTSNNLVQIIWAPHTHVETQAVTAATIAASPVTSLTVTTAFTAIPNAETIWVLKENVTSSGKDSASSKKMYKILNIKESGVNKYDITAVEHYNEKFKSVDVDFGNPYVDTLLKPDESVPAPTNLSSEVAQ
jgi:predicted phage tail protein